MAIIRWDPFREMTQVQNHVNRLVDQVWGGKQESWLPAVDVFDTREAVVLKAELAGKSGPVKWFPYETRSEYGLVDFNQAISSLKGMATG